MKKSIIIFLSFFTYISFWILDANASISRTSNSWVRNCAAWSIPSWTLPRAVPSSWSLTCNSYTYLPWTAYYINVALINWATSCGANRRAVSRSWWNVVCNRRDNTSPDITSTNHNSWNWFNPSIIWFPNLVIRFRDIWLDWSTAQWTLRQVRFNWGSALPADCLSWWTQITSRTAWSISTWTYENYTVNFPATDWEHTLHVCAKDWAWNTRVYSQIYRIDRTRPVPGDITWNWVTKNNTYITAKLVENFTISVWPSWWAPITSIQGRFERANTPATTWNILSNWDLVTSSSPTLTLNRDITLVDNQRNSNNYREYIFRLTQICDAAWNCMTAWNLPTYIYNIYANYITAANSSSSWSNWFTSSNIADWSIRNLNFIIRDQFNNFVLPVPWVRSLAFSVNYNNDLYLNQYNRNWNSWVEISPINWSTFTPWTMWSNRTNNTTISSWTPLSYNLPFRVYSPTFKTWATNWQQYVDWSFTINNVRVTLSDGWWLTTLHNSLDFDFRPPYITGLTWSIIDNWLIVWSPQDWNISVNAWWTKNILLEYWYFDWWNHNAHSNLSMSYRLNTASSLNSIVSWRQSNQSSLTNFWTSTSPIITQLIQNWTLSLAEQNTYFATHIRHVLDAKTIVYSSYVYWMDRYAWTPTWDNTSQRWVKIEWLTHSQKQAELVAWQEWTDYSLLWNLEKSVLQRDIRRNAYSLIREITPSNGSRNITNLNQLSPWVQIWDVLYFWWLNWSNVTLNLSSNFTGRKTILIEWWNLFIRSNTLANNLSQDILWIVVLKDEQWRGWHIFIDRWVTEINAILYADKAIASSDTTRITQTDDLNKILSPENFWTYDYLNTQLYIYGSVFSNNTIWWSVQAPYLCPFFITNLCTLDISQKYDLNYLRRGYDTKRSVSYDDYPVIIKYNSNIQLTPPPLFTR